MTLQNKIVLTGVIALAVTLLMFFMFFTVQQSALSGAPSGIPTTVATTSQHLATPGSLNVISLLIGTSSCNSRIISTRASEVMLGFSDVQGFVPTASIGHQQAASTTVAYDSGSYGCGAIRVFSYATSTVTITESR